MIFLTNNLLPIIIGICGICVVAFLIVLIILLKRKSRKGKVDDAFIQTLLTALGGQGNILNVKMINGRLHVEVTDLEIVKFEELKKLSTAGVFITNQTIKMLFSYDNAAICRALSNKN